MLSKSGTAQQVMGNAENRAILQQKGWAGLACISADAQVSLEQGQQ